MNGLTVLMFIFAFLIILAGLYIYTGHNSELLIWKGYNKNASKEELKNLGKWVMLSSIVPIIIGVIGIFIDV